MRLFYIIVLVFGLVGFTNAQKPFKKYPFKTGVVEYKMEGSAKGTQVITWDDYGYKELTVEKSEMKVFGQVSKTNKSTLALGTKLYEWSDTDNKVYQTSNPIAESWDDEGLDAGEVEDYSIRMIEAMGYEKNGTETMLGKKCDVYKGMGKIWVWNGLSLKTEISMMGVKSVITATNVETNIDVPSVLFELPAGREISTYNDLEIDDNTNNSDEEMEPDEIKNLLKSMFE